MNFRFPVFLDLSGKNCIITGEGHEVPSKVEALVQAGATLTYVNPQADARIKHLVDAGLLHWEPRDFQPSDLDGCFLIIADTKDNAEIFRLAEERQVLCNAVDDPANCRFSFGSIHRQGDLTIAISTNGWAPAVAVRLKEWLQREIGTEYGTLLELLSEVRPEITTTIGDFDARRELWYEIVDSNILELLRSGQQEAAKSLLRQKIDAKVNSTLRSDISAGDVDR